MEVNANATRLGSRLDFLSCLAFGVRRLSSVAHDLRTRGRRKDWFMPTKVKLRKLIVEIRGYAQVTNRRPAPRPPVLYLMELREHTAQVSAPKRKLDVISDAQENPNIPMPIKITHVATEEPLPIVFG